MFPKCNTGSGSIYSFIFIFNEFSNREDGFLTKEELCEAYDYCNIYLHAHNALKIESEVNSEDEWNWIVGIINKIHVLWDKHIYYPKYQGNFYFITMETGKGYPGVNIFGKVQEISVNIVLRNSG